MPGQFVSYHKSNTNPSNGIKEVLDLNIQLTDKINEVYTITIVYKESKITVIDDKKLLYDPDKLDEKGKLTIKGFKIVDAKDGNLMVKPFGDKQKIEIYNKTANKTKNVYWSKLDKSQQYLLSLDKKQLDIATIPNNLHLWKLDKSKQYLLPLDNEQLDKATILDNSFMEHKKSLLGLGCITGDKKSCCGCCYW